MTMPPDEGEDILAFGRTDPPARRPRRRLMFAAAGGTGLAGTAIAVGLLGFGGGAAPAAHHQTTLTQQAIPVTGGAQVSYSEVVLSGTRPVTDAVPVRTGWLLKIDPSTVRTVCPNP